MTKIFAIVAAFVFAATIPALAEDNPMELTSLIAGDKAVFTENTACEVARKFENSEQYFMKNGTLKSVIFHKGIGRIYDPEHFLGLETNVCLPNNPSLVSAIGRAVIAVGKTKASFSGGIILINAKIQHPEKENSYCRTSVIKTKGKPDVEMRVCLAEITK